MPRHCIAEEKMLAQVIERLDALIVLLLPPAPGERDTDEARVLCQCDFGHTRDQIAAEICKPKSVVDPILSRLRRAGHIRSVSRSGKTVYIRTRR